MENALHTPPAPLPRRKNPVAAILLALVFGPFGVFYTSRAAALVLLLMVGGAAIGLGGNINALDNNWIMKPLWLVAQIVSAVWVAVHMAFERRAQRPRETVL